jgi:hypothetical protein
MGIFFIQKNENTIKGRLLRPFIVSLFNMMFHPSPEDQERLPKEMRARSPSRSASRHTVLRGQRGYETGDKIPFYKANVKMWLFCF